MLQVSFWRTVQAVQAGGVSERRAVKKPRAIEFAYGPLVSVLARRTQCALDTGPFVAEEIKRTLLARVLQQSGRDGLIEAGREVASESAHPFVRVLRAQPNPLQLFRAWMQIEVLAHAHNRVRLLDLQCDSLQLLRLRLGDGGAHPLIEEDLFILGVLQGFLTLLGLGEFTLTGPTEDKQGHIWHLGFKQIGPTPECAGDPQGRIWCAAGEIERAVFIIASNLILTDAPVDLVRVARQLGLSARSLQRRLAASGTSFSSLLRAARVTVAGAAVVDGQHTALTELAYRFGFADSAHLCRSFREVVGCSPSQFARIARTQTDA